MPSSFHSEEISQFCSNKLRLACPSCIQLLYTLFPFHSFGPLLFIACFFSMSLDTSVGHNRLALFVWFCTKSKTQFSTSFLSAIEYNNLTEPKRKASRGERLYGAKCYKHTKIGGRVRPKDLMPILHKDPRTSPIQNGVFLWPKNQSWVCWFYTRA